MERMNQTEGVNEDLIVCAGGAQSGGPCKGDSGGPLTITNEEGAHVLVGIVSKRLGESCSQQEYAVFTSVSAFLPWVETSIKENGGMASCGFNFSAPPTLGKSLEPPPPPGLLLLGGQSIEGPLASVEMFGFDNCTIPSLPETRYAFGSFIAPTDPPQLAVCGGWWMGKPNSTDCLTLNVTSNQWERGTFTNGLLGDGVRGVINMEGEGVFVVHSSGISVLPPGSESWVAGPVFSTSAECACNVSSTRFVTLQMSDTQNVREYSVNNGNAELEQVDSWP